VELRAVGTSELMRLIIAMPVLDDWQAARLVCDAIDHVLQEHPETRCTLLLVDDGSNSLVGSTFLDFAPKALWSLQLLKLRRNLGHQRAIAIGLSYIQNHLPCDAVVIMDSDGEDRPEDIPRLVSKLKESPFPVTVFAQRGRRVEGLKFKVFYQLYRGLHFLLTGRGIAVGNFSVIPIEHLNRLVCHPELWNHYAATVVNSRLPWTTVRADRAERLRGESKMNFVSLVTHGLSAVFAYQETVSARILIGSTVLSILLCTFVVAVLILKIFATLKIPGWSIFVAGVLPLMVLQILATSVILVFSGMINRSNLGFLPVRDYQYFVSECLSLQVQ
jgi:glycosyltransferase involved in cell wall biosynthesis